MECGWPLKVQSSAYLVSISIQTRPGLGGAEAPGAVAVGAVAVAAVTKVCGSIAASEPSVYGFSMIISLPRSSAIDIYRSSSVIFEGGKEFSLLRLSISRPD